MSINNLYALLGFAAAGAVGGGIYFIYPNSPKPITTLKERLKKEKYSVLSDDDNQNWQTVLSKYNSSEHKQNNRFVSGNGTTSLEDLKRVCSSTLAMEEGDSISYERVKLWCTVPRTVQERLKDLGIDVLKTSGDTEDKSKWVALESEYKETGNNDIKDFQVDSVTNDTSWQKLRNKCNEYIAKDKWSSEYDYYLDKASKWCSDKK
ncbi:hypothetical protein MHC_01390 [Mycoplasma haemocanis str. Illinois]|uniref:Uncharacterized protein n=1 Tax=Mycoplasma haemocanis (strain Illinois) TaxID=1111676 RepID=H6N672_MYCHN|nr:hypothetical protein [Mycoplasma haemocanis]AEW45144.1 hypothetical protein MHC_01390 [Mycoplasma haemocanis str. Illinois]